MKNKELEIDGERYVTKREAARLTGYEYKIIRDWINENTDSIRQVRKTFIYIHYGDMLKCFLYNPPKFTDHSDVWGEINPLYDGNRTIYRNRSGIQPLCFINGYKYQYMVLKNFTVYDATNKRVVTPWKDKNKDGKLNGRYRVDLIPLKGRQRVHRELHRLIAEAMCGNNLNKDIVHHIQPTNLDKDISENHSPDNLLWVTREEHTLLHRILRDNGNDYNAPEYRQLVDEIKAENEKSFKIPHPYIPEDDNYKFWMYLTPKGYDEFCKSGEIKKRIYYKRCGREKGNNTR